MFLKEEKVQILKDFGIKIVRGKEEEEGTKESTKKRVNYKVQYQGRKLPRITFMKGSQMFKIFYQAPNDFGQQSWEFDYFDFVEVENKIKEVRQYAKNVSEFNEKKFEILKNWCPNDYVVFIFMYFGVKRSFLALRLKEKKDCNKLFVLEELFLNELEMLEK